MTSWYLKELEDLEEEDITQGRTTLRLAEVRLKMVVQPKPVTGFNLKVWS